MSVGALGVLGGTFDPIHVGHLILGEHVAESLGLEKVLFVPAGTPGHKRPDAVTSPEHRCRMTALAIADNPRFELCTVDLARQGVTYTVDTLGDLRRLYPNQELFFIIGSDNLLDLPNWREPERVLALCYLAVVFRPGFPIHEVQDKLGALYIRERMRFVPSVAIEISSTSIRQRIKEGRSVRYLIPEPVAAYIKEHRLYGYRPSTGAS